MARLLSGNFSSRPLILWRAPAQINVKFVGSAQSPDVRRGFSIISHPHPMITLRGVQKSFGQHVLFQDASLQINEGDRYVLVGPNGSGKSTLFKILLGEEEADAGQFTIRRGAAVGYLPQENAPVSDQTVLDTALAHHEDPDGRLTAKAKAILMGLGFKVADFGRRLDALSGGGGMRAAMARLLMAEPDLLLLDEPTNHLDI